MARAPRARLRRCGRWPRSPRSSCGSPRAAARTSSSRSSSRPPCCCSSAASPCRRACRAGPRTTSLPGVDRPRRSSRRASSTSGSRPPTSGRTACSSGSAAHRSRGGACSRAKAGALLVLELVQVALLVGVAVAAFGWAPGPGWSPILAAVAIVLGTLAFAGARPAPRRHAPGRGDARARERPVPRVPDARRPRRAGRAAPGVPAARRRRPAGDGARRPPPHRARQRRADRARRPRTAAGPLAVLGPGPPARRRSPSGLFRWDGSAGAARGPVLLRPVDLGERHARRRRTSARRGPCRSRRAEPFSVSTNRWISVP